MSKSLEAKHERRRGSDVVDQLCINTIRTLSMDAVQKANSMGRDRFLVCIE